MSDLWLQVEYLVVVYSQDDKKVLLSLRQAEILTALASDHELAKQGGCTAEQQNGDIKKDK
jgi:glutamate--cysteine ligase catalytic subunit